MNMRIDESRDNGKAQCVDVFGILWQSQVRYPSNGIDSAIANDDAAWRECFGRTQDRTSVDDESAITHVRYPDAPGLCGGCHRPR